MTNSNNGELKEKYNLFTAICSVVGIVIGTGIFFKATPVLQATGGNLLFSTLAWIIGGIVMILCAYSFALISMKYKNISGIGDFAKYTVSKEYSYYVSSFIKYIYLPGLTGVIAFVAGMYTSELFKLNLPNFPLSYDVFLFAAFYLVLIFLLNYLAPIISGKFQISTTIIKLIPLVLMGVVGVIIGSINGVLISNFQKVTETLTQGSQGMFAGICITAFSYEGWISATNIAGELKNKERNLPLALIIGTIIVIIIYLLYNLGIAGASKIEDLIDPSQSATLILQNAFSNIFGNVFASVLIVFVVISALGSLNGMYMSSSRCAYNMAKEDMGIFPDYFKKIDKRTNTPLRSCIFALLISGFWLAYYYLSNNNAHSDSSLGFPFGIDELPVITTYMLYIPIFIFFIKKSKDLSIIKRFIILPLSIASCILMIAASIYRHKMHVIYYFIFFFIFILLAFIVRYGQTKISKKVDDTKV